MSRFADPQARETIPLGACQCPGTPHEQDEAVIRYQLGASALARIGRAEIEGAVRLDPMAGYRQTVLETVVEWNFIAGENGSAGPVPITPATVAELDLDTLKVLAEKADDLIQAKGTLPNSFGARSRASSAASASRTPKPRQTPTT